MGLSGTNNNTVSAAHVSTTPAKHSRRGKAASQPAEVDRMQKQSFSTARKVVHATAGAIGIGALAGVGGLAGVGVGVAAASVGLALPATLCLGTGAAIAGTVAVLTGLSSKPSVQHYWAGAAAAAVGLTVGLGAGFYVLSALVLTKVAAAGISAAIALAATATAMAWHAVYSNSGTSEFQPASRRDSADLAQLNKSHSIG